MYTHRLNNLNYSLLYIYSFFYIKAYEGPWFSTIYLPQFTIFPERSLWLVYYILILYMSLTSYCLTSKRVWWDLIRSKHITLLWLLSTLGDEELRELFCVHFIKKNFGGVKFLRNEIPCGTGSGDSLDRAFSHNEIRVEREAGTV